MTPVPYILRNLTDDDHDFIFHSFLKNYHTYFSASTIVNHSIYYKNQTDIIQYLLNKAKVLIMCFPEDPSEIMGYVIYEYLQKTLVIHYFYIKKLYRRQGIFREVVSGLCGPQTSTCPSIIIATHITDIPYHPDHGSAATFNNIKNSIPNKKMYYDPYYISNQRLYGTSSPDRFNSRQPEVIYKIAGQS